LFIDPGETVPEDVWKALEAKAVGIKPTKNRNAFTIGGDNLDYAYYSLAYCVVLIGTPGSSAKARRLSDRDLIRGFNLQQRLQTSPTKVTDSVQAAPLFRVDGISMPYDGARADDWQFFEYWCNSLFTENTDVSVKEFVQFLLQGRALKEGGSEPSDVVNPACKPIYRWLPRTSEEQEKRKAERTALAKDPEGTYRWLDDNEAVAVIRVMMQDSFEVLPPVPGDDRGRLFKELGSEYQLSDGTTPQPYLAYHATARGPEKVRTDGTERSVVWRGDGIGVNQPWSPLRSDNGWNGELLYRRGSKDNELHTTVSIAQSPVTAIDFPIIQSVLWDNSDFRKVKEGTGSVALAKGVYSTRGVPAFTYREKDRFETATWVYPVAVDDFYDTAGLQGGEDEKFASTSSEVWLNGEFDGHGEFATTGIPASRHLFGAEYIRVHYGERRESGMRYRLNRVVPLGIAQWVGKKPLDWKTGDPLPPAVRFLAEQLVKFPMCGVKRGVSMPDEVYAQALADAVDDYSGIDFSKVFTEVDEFLETLFSTGQSSSKIKFLDLEPKLKAAWDNAVKVLNAQKK